MDFKNKYIKYKKKYLNLKKKEMVGSGKEEWVPKKYLVQNNRIWIELHKIDVDTKEKKDIMFAYRSNSGLLWHMYTAKNNLAQIPKIDELYSTSYLLDLSLQKKINDLLDLLDEGSLENMNSEHGSSRFSFSNYYIDTMTNFLDIEGDILNNQNWKDLWNEVINNTEQNEILNIFRNTDDSNKDLSFIRDNIYNTYKCPSISKSKEKKITRKMAETSRNTKEIYNEYNEKISEKLNNHFTIDNESKTCHFTTTSNISFVDYDDDQIANKRYNEIYKYIRYIEAKIEYSVNSIKIRSNKKDFHLIFMNYNFISNKDVTEEKYWDEDFPPQYQLNKEMFEKTYNAPLFLTNDLSSLNNRYPVYNKIIPMGIYTCKIFEYQHQVKGKLYDEESNLYLFLGQYMNNMWPFKYLDESKCEHDKNIPNNYINRIEELKKEIEKLKEMNVENKNMIEILNKEYEKQKNVNKENYDNLLMQNSFINSKLEEVQKEYNELLNKK